MQRTLFRSRFLFFKLSHEKILEGTCIPWPTCLPCSSSKWSKCTSRKQDVVFRSCLFNFYPIDVCPRILETAKRFLVALSLRTILLLHNLRFLDMRAIHDVELSSVNRFFEGFPASISRRSFDGSLTKCGMPWKENVVGVWFHESGYGFQGASVGGKYSFGAAIIYSPSPREGTEQVLPTPQRAPALPTHLVGGGWPKVLDGMQWTMTEHSLASRLEAVCVYGVGEWGRGGCAVQ